MIGRDRFERDDREFGNSVRRPESPSYEALVDHNSNDHSNPRQKLGDLPGTDRCLVNSETKYSNELNHLSLEINQRITQQMKRLMNSVNLQIQRAISEAINEQFLFQLHASLRSLNEPPPQKV